MTVKEYPVIWLEASGCSGCFISVLNSNSPTVRNLLIDPVLPGKHLNLLFGLTIMAGSGEMVMDVLQTTVEQKKGEYILVVEGAVPTNADGLFCCLGKTENTPLPVAQTLEPLARNALATIAVGTCSAFGGVSAAAPNPTGARLVGHFFDMKQIKTPLINLPGCPCHPDWFTGTIAAIMLRGLPRADELDEFKRPIAFYGDRIHDNCPRFNYYASGKFAQHAGDEGCFLEIGCQGRETYADCPLRRWNAAVSWCIDAGTPCIGCAKPGFPDIAGQYDNDKLTATGGN